ncbi:sulfonate transport system ATP-binding protein [Seinonella peptonophila]|uniref:Sulfonate transport system ATP-binding protein n=1 Tax=Seinonella peptonophila TaxID=112248 RepID=A0A1M4SNN6_9BACL|nr:ATP-binding cassette domain-containing protein [Seinonella peptonophila]SHE33798.1 sulfonate transport system ATP-binding protein [Seinonella peptonophila]
MKGIPVQIDQVKKSFQSLEVLKRIDLSLRSGEFLAVVGRSGCGKSTLLRLIAGLEQMSAGEIYINQEPITGTHPDLRMMFQDARLLPWKTVIKNVQIGLRTKETTIAEKALEMVGLTDKFDQWPSSLSGGQRQRVALARALAGQPKLLLLDEPLGALDALTRIEMQQLIEDLWSKQQFTAILVTHDVSEAVMLADRVIVIEAGKITFDQKIELARPRERNNDFVYYEQMILDQLIKKSRRTHYEIEFTV